MHKTIHYLVVVILAVLNSNTTFATAQYGDQLVIGKDTVFFNSNPLVIYFEKKGARPLIVTACTDIMLMD